MRESSPAVSVEAFSDETLVKARRGEWPILGLAEVMLTIDMSESLRLDDLPDDCLQVDLVALIEGPHVLRPEEVIEVLGVSVVFDTP